MFDVNMIMHIRSADDFANLTQQITVWRRRFPMFRHDVDRIERIVDTHIQNHSIAMVFHRQTHKTRYLEDAQSQIDAINQVVTMVEQLELMALLSQ